MNRVSLYSLLILQDTQDNDNTWYLIIDWSLKDQYFLQNLSDSIFIFHFKFSTGRGLESDYEEIGPPKYRAGQSQTGPRVLAQCDLCGNNNPIVTCQECLDQVRRITIGLQSTLYTL